MNRKFFLLGIVLCAFTNCQANKSEQSEAEDPVITEVIKAIQLQSVESCKLFNQQCPIQLNDETLLRSVTFLNMTWTYCYEIKMDFSNKTEDELKEEMILLKLSAKKNLPNVMSRIYGKSPKEFYMILKETGMKIRFAYFDQNNIALGAFTFDYSDFQ